MLEITVLVSYERAPWSLMLTYPAALGACRLLCGIGGYQYRNGL